MYDAWRVKDDRNGNGKNDELQESGDLAGEEEEDRYDPDDTKEQWPEQTL